MDLRVAIDREFPEGCRCDCTTLKDVDATVQPERKRAWTTNKPRYVIYYIDLYNLL